MEQIDTLSQSHTGIYPIIPPAEKNNLIYYFTTPWGRIFEVKPEKNPAKGIQMNFSEITLDEYAQLDFYEKEEQNGILATLSEITRMYKRQLQISNN